MVDPVEKACSWFRGRRIGVIGLGREGRALALFLTGIGAEVVATDDRRAESIIPQLPDGLHDKIELHLSGLSGAVIDTDCCFVSPGVSLEHPLVLAAKRRGVCLWNEIGLTMALCPATIIGITGSSGKSTTSALTHAILTATGFKTYLGGNIGSPLLNQVGEMQASDLVVLELSSFQLELAGRSPQIAGITNITPNHLDRHHSMEAYVAAKENAFLHQDHRGVLVLNEEDAYSSRFASRASGSVMWFSRRTAVPEGAYLYGDYLNVTGKGAICRVEEVKLLGTHNLGNVLASLALASAAGADLESMHSTVTSFTGLPHRLELVARVNGVKYYNDSIATSPERSIAALRAISGPIILLAGGRDKKLDWRQWAEAVRERARIVIAFGEAGSMIEKVLRSSQVPVERFQSMAESVRRAKDIATPGDSVLLSPGGTSFDEFSDFEQRGQVFRELVNETRSHDS